MPWTSERGSLPTKTSCFGHADGPKTEKEFTPGEWSHAATQTNNRQNNRGKCTECMQRDKVVKKCFVCKKSKAKGFFSENQWTEKDCVCNGCKKHAVAEKDCSCCGKSFPKAGHFIDSQWERGPTKRHCNECVAALKSRPGYWKCKAADCNVVQRREEFTLWLAGRTDKKNTMARYDATIVMKESAKSSGLSRERTLSTWSKKATRNKNRKKTM
jgi:hypothetical protein